MKFELIKELFDIKSNLFGFSKSEIEKAEIRLGIKFPLVLKEYYQELRKHEQLNQTQDRLLNLDEIELDKDGYLIFYAENQYVAIRGIRVEDLKLPNPKVYRKEEQWELDSTELSAFFNSMALMQALFSMNYHANSCGIQERYYKIVTDNFREIEYEFSLWNVKFYRNKMTELIAIFKNGEQIDVLVTVKNKEDFDAVLGKFDFEWDFNSERDN